MTKLFLMLIGMMMSTVCLAHIDDTYIHEEILQQIIVYEDLCVERIEDEKIYLQHNRIFPTSNGIYLKIDEVNFILLNNISSDTKGCYIEARIPILNTCRHCQRSYFVRCTNPDCPGKKR